MKIVKFLEKYQKEIVIALGFFDCIHIGHKALINKTKLLADKYNADSCVFTFDNNLFNLSKSESGTVFTFSERLKKLEKLAIGSVIFASFTKEFSSILPSDFLQLLIDNYNVKAIVCGVDYKFGKDAKGNISLLKTVCQNYNIELSIIEDVTSNERKISTSEIKNLLVNGLIEEANSLLGCPYFLTGEVVHGRQVGRQLGFPTANVNVSNEKLKIKSGVYKTHAIIDDKIYKGITNYGTRPTYGLDYLLTETYFLGFDGDLYGKTITIYFDGFIRDCVKFDSEDKLQQQIKSDLEKLND